MKTLRVLTLALTAILAMGLNAAHARSMLPHQSCATLQAVYAADGMNQEVRNCKSDKACQDLQLEQARASAKLHGVTDPNPDNLSKVIIDELYDPIFTRVTVGHVQYDVVNLSFGDNPYHSFFVPGTTIFAGILIEDGSPKVDGAYCDVAFEPVITTTRRQAVCDQLVPLVRSKLPKAKFTMSVCMSEKPDAKTKNILDVGIEEFNSKRIALRIGRNLKDVNGGYLSCSGQMDRASSKLLSLRCEIK